MSTTLEYEQALKYTRGSADEPSLLFVMQMGMVSVSAELVARGQFDSCSEVDEPTLLQSARRS